MTDSPSPSSNEHHTGRLIELTPDEQREVMLLWWQATSGMEGERGPMPDKPDDPVAYLLLNAAGEAMGRNQWQKGVNILRLLIRDYPRSKEAAGARQAIDRLQEQAGTHGR